MKKIFVFLKKVQLYHHGEFPNGWKITTMGTLRIVLVLCCLAIGFGVAIITMHKPVHIAAIFLIDAYLALAAILISFGYKDETPAICWALIAFCLMCHLLSSLFLS